MCCLIYLVLTIILHSSLYDCYYHKFQDESSGFGEEYLQLDSTYIHIDVGNSLELFPNEFNLNINLPDGELSLKFIKNTGSVTPNNPSIYISEHDEIKEQIIQIDSTTELGEYTEEKGKGSLTLIHNKDINDQKYRILTTILIHDCQIHISPVVDNTNGQNQKHYHALFKHNKAQSYRNDYLNIPEQDIKYEQNENLTRLPYERRKRETEAFNFYVETLLVLDNSIISKYQALFGTTFLFEFLKIHFSHILNAADLRFTNTFNNDPLFKINLRLANILIYPNIKDTPWTDRSIVPFSGYATLNGIEVIDTIQSIIKFKNEMSNRTFPFRYDHAIAITAKDLKSYSEPKHVISEDVGIAYRSGICSQFRYSVVEDYLLATSFTIAHEIGHNLGSKHDSPDEGINCSPDDAYVMHPYVGTRSNFANQYKFSNCSISQFKSQLTSNGVVSASGQCLLNVPTTLPIIDINYEYLNGRLLSANDQCKISYGSASFHCSSIRGLCETIWCYTGDGYCSASNGVGAYDGTVCGAGKICYKTECVNENSIPNGSLKPSTCAQKPCLNGGTCVLFSLFYICNCPVGFTGQNCEILTTTTTTTTKTSTTTTEVTTTTAVRGVCRRNS